MASKHSQPTAASILLCCIPGGSPCSAYWKHTPACAAPLGGPLATWLLALVPAGLQHDPGWV
jgi:hypothetical protein